MLKIDKSLIDLKVLLLALAVILPGQVLADIAQATALQGRTGVLQDYRRLLPLAGGSNFRDMGGYPAADGKTVRRGLLYRSGVMTSLTADDQAYLGQIGFESIVDLRSEEELEIFPNRWAAASGIDYYHHDYSIMDLLGERMQQGEVIENGGELYRSLPYTIVPQLKQYFALLVDGKAPLVVNCSAGQDRTGIASSLLLTVLGVPRDLVIEDYLLSTDFRRPVVERGDVDLAAFAATNAFAALMARYSQAEQTHAEPLVTDEGVPYLVYAFDQIEKDYGSIRNFMDQELGVDAGDIETLKTLYLQ